MHIKLTSENTCAIHFFFHHNKINNNNIIIIITINNFYNFIIDIFYLFCKYLF